jgi:hypothetical protein
MTSHCNDSTLKGVIKLQCNKSPRLYVGGKLSPEFQCVRMLMRLGVGWAQNAGRPSHGRCSDEGLSCAGCPVSTRPRGTLITFAHFDLCACLLASWGCDDILRAIPCSRCGMADSYVIKKHDKINIRPLVFGIAPRSERSGSTIQLPPVAPSGKGRHPGEGLPERALFCNSDLSPNCRIVFV